MNTKVYGKRKSKVPKIVWFSTLILWLIIWWFLLYKNIENNKENLNGKIAAVNNIIKDIYTLQSQINKNNNKTRDNILQQLKDIKEELKQNKTNLNKIKEIKEKNKQLKKILLILRKNWINLNINVKNINLIDYNKLIIAIDTIRENLIDNDYKKDFDLWHIKIVEDSFNKENPTTTIWDISKKIDTTNISDNKNTGVKQTNNIYKATTIENKQALQNNNIKKIDNLNSLWLSNQQIKILTNITKGK